MFRIGPLALDLWLLQIVTLQERPAHKNEQATNNNYYQNCNDTVVQMYRLLLQSMTLHGF